MALIIRLIPAGRPYRYRDKESARCRDYRQNASGARLPPDASAIIIYLFIQQQSETASAGISRDVTALITKENH